MTASYLERLAARSAATGTVLCLGIDPHPGTLPAGFPPTVAGIERFATLLLEAAGPHAAAVKPNIAFFEAFGSAGLAALERLRARVPTDLPVIVDAKRGDLSSTSVRYAAALLDGLAADAVTLSPYLGEEAIASFLDRPDRFAYVLCRTSNPGAGEFQDLEVAAEPATGAPAEALHRRVARRVAGWGIGGTVGLVVGATAPEELAAIRQVAPGLAFLVPGVGAQGGEAEAVLAHGRATEPPAGGRPGGGLVVNVSRGIASSAVSGTAGDEAGNAAGGDPFERLATAAADWARRLPVLP